jgi:hypothetical protein
MEDKTKQKIQELVPEIMELKFGCEIDRNKNDGRETIIRIRENHPFLFTAIIFRDTFGTFTQEIEKESCKILGRPITLADVLLAMEKVGKYILVDITGNLFTHDMSDGALVDEGIWDLTKNYDDQEQSVKDFIGQILGVK